MEARDMMLHAPDPLTPPPERKAERSGESIEELCFASALICLEGHFTQCPPMGPQTMTRVNGMIAKILEKTHTVRKARENLSKNVEVWIWITRIFAAAIPSLTTRSVGPLEQLNDPEKGVTTQESTDRIVANHASIKEDLGTLIKLMHISRNLLVNSDPSVPQDLCAAVQFNQMVYQTIILCVNVTSKGYDGEVLEDAQRLKLSDITELYKKLLVTALQQAHNWTAKHDRNKMCFWFDVLFDDDGLDDPEYTSDPMGDGSGFRPEIAKQQIQHWVERNSKMCNAARKLLQNYAISHPPGTAGSLAPIRPLAWNWLKLDEIQGAPPRFDDAEKINPIWKPDETDKFEQDRVYGRVSREIDTWWLRARDPNYEDWVVAMPSVEFAQSRTDHCKNNLIHRFGHMYEPEHSHSGVIEEELSDAEHCHHCENGIDHDHELDGDIDDEYDDDHDHEYEECDHDHDHDHDHYHEHEHEHDHDHDHDHEHDHDHDYDDDEDDDHHHHHHHHHHPHHHHHHDHHHHHHHHDHDHHHHHDHDYVDEMIDEEVDDDDSYGEGPLTGLLTEVPNILDPKQIEALHMIVKSCILDNAGSGLTRAGENLQKTRCRLFMAMDCGKSLLRELLVFIAVWEKDEQSLIFQVTTQIIEALHHSALIPYAWNSLRIPKDIISPAQTVLLRLVNHMFRARINNNNNNTQEAKDRDNSRDIKLVHFFFSFFRSRIVPECAALMHLQAQIREEHCDPMEFPVDSWDMERAKDGLAQYLDFLTTVAEMLDTRTKLIEWEAIYDLITILSGLEAAVAKKPLIELPKRAPRNENGGSNPAERPYSAGDEARPPSPPPPPLQDPAHKFPWSGIKGQIFTIIATLLQPPPGQSSPGNPDIQMQMVRYNGIVPLLNCCAYDDHNPFAKERVTICLKWLLDGCEAANNFFRELVSLAPQPNLRPPPGGSTVSTIKVDGIEGEVKVQVRSNAEERMAQNTEDIINGTGRLDLNQPSGRGSLEDDFMA